MDKHAYLIIANNNWDQLLLQLQLLDHEKNDIFLMIDAKADFNDEIKFKNSLCYSKLIFVERMKIFWGGYTQILATLSLLKAAVSENEYTYYHLLSGSDLPLTSQENIHSFFEQNKGKEFLTFSGMGTDSQLYDRVKYTYHFSKLTHRMTNNKWLQKIIRLYRKIDLKIQKLQNIDRWKKENPDKYLKYGSQWFSITHDLVLYILENEQWIEKSFKDTYLCDELFVHTLVYNSKFYECVYNSHPVRDIPNEQQGNLRYINWWDGSPYTWSLSSKEDLLQLNHGIELGHLFSRKFNLTHQEINEIRRNLFETATNSDSSSLS